MKSIEKRDRPYPITRENAAKSPMKTTEQVRQCLHNYHLGIPIGFSRTSSLKSMGLIPRKDGSYTLGHKYMQQ